jgi:hypothetical protein
MTLPGLDEPTGLGALLLLGLVVAVVAFLLRGERFDPYDDERR